MKYIPEIILTTGLVLLLGYSCHGDFKAEENRNECRSKVYDSCLKQASSSFCAEEARKVCRPGTM